MNISVIFIVCNKILILLSLSWKSGCYFSFSFCSLLPKPVTTLYTQSHFPSDSPFDLPHWYFHSHSFRSVPSQGWGCLSSCQMWWLLWALVYLEHDPSWPDRHFAVFSPQARLATIHYCITFIMPNSNS